MLYITGVFNSLLCYSIMSRFFLGDNADWHISLRNHVQDLKEKLQELQDTPPAPTTTPHPTLQQPLHPARSIRCKCCSAIGHNTDDCHTKDPICYDFELLSDSSLYLCLVLGKLSIVYSHLLGSRFNLSSPRVPLVGGIVLEVWERSSTVNKLSSSYRTLLVTTGLYT